MTKDEIIKDPKLTFQEAAMLLEILIKTPIPYGVSAPIIEKLSLAAKKENL